MGTDEHSLGGGYQDELVGLGCLFVVRGAVGPCDHPDHTKSTGGHV